jgi:hypothetical protein
MIDTNNISQKSTPIKTLHLAARVIGSTIEQNIKNSGAYSKPPDILLIATVVCLLIAFCGLIIVW